MTSKFASLTEQDIEKLVDDKESQNTKRSTKVAKELFADYVKAKKLRKRYFHTIRNKLSVPLTVMTIFFFVQCIIKQLLDSVFVIYRIIKVSVRVIG